MQRYDRSRLIAAPILVAALAVLAFGVRRAMQPLPAVIEGTIDAQQIDVGSKVAGRDAACSSRSEMSCAPVHRSSRSIVRNCGPRWRPPVGGAQRGGSPPNRRRSGLRVTRIAALRARLAGSRERPRGPNEDGQSQGNGCIRSCPIREQRHRRALGADDLRAHTAALRRRSGAGARANSALAAFRAAEQQARSAYEIYHAAASGSRPEDIVALRAAAATAAGALQVALAEQSAALGRAALARAQQRRYPRAHADRQLGASWNDVGPELLDLAVLALVFGTIAFAILRQRAGCRASYQRLGRMR